MTKTALRRLIATTIVVGLHATPAAVSAQTPGPTCGGQPATIIGTAGDDVIEGTAGDDVIVSAQGNDTILAFGGNDIVCAGRGDDVVVGGQGFDIVFGAQGDDVLFAANGSSIELSTDIRGARLFGGAGDDVLIGSDRWDRMQGGPGVDYMAGFEGRDWMRGGPDADYIDGGANIDDMHGGSGADHLRATTADSVRGSTGDDQCELTGTPKILRSCTSSATAFSDVEYLPTVPPTAEGLDQTASGASALINQRDLAHYAEIAPAQCQTTVTDIATAVGSNDRAFGKGWTVEFSVIDATIDGMWAEVDLYLRFFNSQGSFIHEQTQTDIFLYERGLWRSTNCVNR